MLNAEIQTPPKKFKQFAGDSNSFVQFKIMLFFRKNYFCPQRYFWWGY